jgi:hypothetical protein
MYRGYVVLACVPLQAKMPSEGSSAQFSGSTRRRPRERVASVPSTGIAIWDVLKACVPVGSLDSAINAASVVPNDFAAFLAERPGAADLFQRRHSPGALLEAGPARAWTTKRIWNTAPAVDQPGQCVIALL